MHRFALAAALLLLAACGGPPPAPPAPARWRTSHRLADDAARAAGLTVPPMETIGMTSRYALAAAPSARLVLDVPAATATEFETALECPPEVRGRRVAIVSPAGVRPLVDLVDCRDDAAAVRIPLHRMLPGRAFSLPVHLRAEPPRRLETAPLALPAGSVLRVAVGLADPRPPERKAAARFVVTAQDASGRSVELFSRVLDPVKRPGEAGWVDVDIPLEPARGLTGDVRLVFEGAATGSEEVAFPVWGDPTVRVPDAAPRRWNVILISIDTLRADRLGCYGNLAGNSPTIDGLASEGTLFEAAVAQSSWTLPSHASMLTGLYGCAHRVGLSENVADGAAAPDIMAHFIGDRLPPTVTPLAELVRAAGWTTAAFTEDAYVSAASFGRGFGLFLADTGDRSDPPGNVEETLARGRTWLAAHAEEPFFLFLHTYQVHYPYTPPPPYGDLLAARLADEASHEPRARAAAELALYDGEIRYTDAVLGSLVPALRELGLADRTIVIVTSDHGEAFLEHGQMRHGSQLFEETIHIPFIWWAPGLVAAGRRLQIPAGLVDIAPTVLDLLGIRVPPWVQGVTLAPFLRSAEPPTARARSRRVFSQVMLGAEYPMAVRGFRWKTIITSPAKQVTYFLMHDPGEQHPVAARHFENLVQSARRSFAHGCARVQAMLRDGGAPAAPPLPEAADSAQLRKLRALGYVQ